MPLVTVKEIEGVFTPEQKRQLVSRLTDAIVEAAGERLPPGTRIVVEVMVEAMADDVMPGEPGLEEARPVQLSAAAITEAISAAWCA
jgi:4-oxalocrotonate tautomerase